MSMRSLSYPLIVLSIGLLAVSTASTLIRFAQQAEAASLVIAAFRMLSAAVAMGIVVSWRRTSSPLESLSKRTILLLILSGLLLAAHFALWITSLEITSVTNSVVLVTTTPLWVGLMSPFVLKEPTRGLTWVAIAIVIVGGITISLSGQNAGTGKLPTVLGDALALAGAVTGAGYLIIGRLVRSEISLLPYLFVVYSVACLCLILLSTILGTPITNVPTAALGWVLAVGLVPQLIGHSAINYAMRRLSASFVAITIIGEAVFSVILAIVFLREVPTLAQTVGAVIIISGIALALFAESLASSASSTVVKPELGKTN